MAAKTAANKTEPIVVEVDCPDCGATGLYSGLGEKRGTAVRCWTCKGTGAKLVTIKPFKGRKRRDDIDTVLFRRKSGNITRTYEQFLAGDLPPDEE